MPPQELPVVASGRFSGAVILNGQSSPLTGTFGYALQVDSTGKLAVLNSSGVQIPIMVPSNPAAVGEAMPFSLYQTSVKMVDFATTGNIANLATGAPLSVDIMSVLVGTRVLVKNQTTTSQNGIYTVVTVGTGSNGVWVRAADSDSAIDFVNQTVVVTNGFSQMGNVYKTNSAPTTVGTDAVVYYQIGSGVLDRKTNSYFKTTGAAASGHSDSAVYTLQAYDNITTVFALLNSDSLPMPLEAGGATFTPAIRANGGSSIGYGWIELDTNKASGVVAGDTLGILAFGGPDNAVVNRALRARVRAEAAGTWTGSTDNPTRLFLGTTPSGSGTYVDRMVIDQDGTVYAGASTSEGALDRLKANNQTGTTYTLVLTDRNKILELNNASAIALTIPTNATIAFPIGTVISIYQMGAGQITVSGAGTTIRAPGGAKTRVQYSVITLWKRGTDEWVISGDTTT